MENSKPTYENLEQELNEYKQLLWQLSDEYRENMGNIEKKLLEQTTKLTVLEKNAEKATPEDKLSFITNLGLPACVLSDEGIITRYNNKFKFLVELLGIEIEEISNISILLTRDKDENLSKKLINYLISDDGVFQSLFKVENSFQGIINLILRVYKFDSGNEHLALFIELHKSEISGLNIIEQNEEVENEQLSSKSIDTENETNGLKTEVAIFAEKYEVFTEVIKHFEDIDPSLLGSFENLQNLVKKPFNLDTTRNKILEKFNTHFKEFVNLIRKKYPDLTPNEEKHCMLIRAGLTYKEISAIMDISINGVKIARNRLRKKLDLENDTKTSEFIDKV